MKQEWVKGSGKETKKRNQLRKEEKNDKFVSLYDTAMFRNLWITQLNYSKIYPCAPRGVIA